MSKLIILVYCMIRFVTEDMQHIPFVVLSVLIYVSVNMVGYLCKARAYKICMFAISCMALIVSAHYAASSLILLLPANLMDIARHYSRDLKAWALWALSSALFCDGSLWAELVLTGLFSFTVYALSYRLYSGFEVLKQERDLLKEKNDALYKKLDMEAEYENQIKYLTQLEERNALAQKIHDKVGHTIAGSLVQLQAASLLLDRDREKAREILGNTLKHLKEGMEDIRSTLRSIKPAQEQLGLGRLKAMLDEFSLRNPIRTELSCKGSIDVITHAQWRIIIENTKEALTNTLKYASASAVTVSIEVMNRLIRSEVRDNGIGGSPVKKGLGIRGMEERTENAGGQLIIDGSRGFSVITLLPVREEEHEDTNPNRR